MPEDSTSRLTTPNTQPGILLHKADAIDQVAETSEHKSLEDAPVTMTKEADVEDPSAATIQNGRDEGYLTGKKLALAHIGFLLASFCRALDQTFVSTALPKLASHFNALDQLTWVVSAYFLTQASLILTFGQMMTISPSKWVYLISIILFEIGSLICAVAPSMNVLIFGRAFQGVGSSGIFV